MLAWLLRQWPWPKRAYLGHTILQYHAEGKPDQIIQRMCIHFWADPRDPYRRRQITFGQGSESGARHHQWFWQNVTPWLSGGNLYPAIHYPSTWLVSYASRTSGYKRVGDKWVKPAPVEHREGNVVTLKVQK